MSYVSSATMSTRIARIVGSWRVLWVGLLLISLMSLSAAEANVPNQQGPKEITGTIHLLANGCGNPNYKGPAHTLIIKEDKTFVMTALDGAPAELAKVKMGSRVTVKGSYKVQNQAHAVHQDLQVFTYTTIDSSEVRVQDANGPAGAKAPADQTSSASGPVAAAAAPTITQLRCLLVFANTNDRTVSASTITAVQNLMFYNTVNVANAIEHNTYGHYKLVPGDTVTVTLPINAAGTDDMTMWSQMMAAANVTHPAANYGRILCLAPQGTDFGSAIAWGYIYGKDTLYNYSYYNNSPSINDYTHELGHNFGFRHSGLAGGNEYSDRFCAMGADGSRSTSRTETFAGVKKFQAGWLASFDTPTVKTTATLTTDATYDLYPISQNPSTVPGMRQVQIASTSYFISYMKNALPYEYMPSVSQAVTVHTHSSGAVSWRQSTMQSAGNQYMAGTTKVIVERFGPSNSYATVSFDLNDGNTKPVANAQTLYVWQNTGRSIVLTGSDADSNPLTFATVTSPINGALTGTAPNLTYTPNAGFIGSDSFVFKVHDGNISSFATVTINVTNVPPTVTWTAASQSSANESGTMTVTATLSYPALVGNATVPFTVSGTATSGADYTVTTSPITIPVGATTGTATITIASDTLHELGGETVILTMGTPTNATLGATTVHTATITDDDNIAPAVNAGLDQTTALGAQIPWTPNLTALASWYDAADSSTITASSNAVSQWRDKSGNSLHLSQSTGTLQPATGSTINSLNAINFTGDRMDTASNPFGATISNAFVIAVHKVDAVANGTFFSLGAGSNRWQSHAPWSDGKLYFDCGGAASPNRVSATYGVSAGSSALVSFYCSTAANVQQVHKNGTLLVGDSSGHAVATTGNITVGGIGTESQDTTLGEFIIINGTVDAATREKLEGYLAHKWGLTANLPAVHPYKSAAPMSATAVVNLDGTVSDANGDPVTTTWTVVSGPGPVSFGNPSAVDTTAMFSTAGEYFLRLTGNDGYGPIFDEVKITVSSAAGVPVVAWTVASQSSVNESGTLTVTAQLSAVSAQTVTIPFTVTGTALAGDRTITTSPITIAAGATTGTVTIAITSDTIDEANVTVILTMGTPTNATLGATTVHTATITDDDAAPTVGFMAASSSGSEATTAVTLPVSLSVVSGQSVTVNYAVTGGTATGGGVDYTLASGTLTFVAGVTTQNIAITVVNDVMDEANETIQVSLSSPSNATLGATMHTYTISDNDSAPTVTWSKVSQASLSESGTLRLNVVLSAPSSLTVSVPFTLSGTASGSDYTMIASPISIAPGDTVAAADITITADTIIEGDETVIVTMGTPTNATLGAITVHTATITDDDSSLPTVALTAASQSSAGETGTMTVTAQLSATSGQVVSVPFAVTGTSGAGDRTISASPISIAVGATTGTATITITADTLDEPNETVILTMGTPTNATLGATTVHTATITDDDAAPTVAWTSASQSSAGETGIMMVTAQLSAASGQAVSVPFTVTGTATSGSDYTITASPISIAAGATTGAATITITADAVAESNETVILTMGTPTNATTGATTVHTATIAEAITFTSVALTPLSTTVIKGGTVPYTAKAKDQYGADLNPQPTFTWSTSGGGTIASSGLFTSNASGTFTITAQATSGGITKSGTTQVTVTEPIAVKINFQPATAPTVAGYVIDSGLVYGSRGNGFTYGWNADITNTSRDRNVLSDQLRDTLLHMQQSAVPNASWEIAVPNGRYQVLVVCGDPSYYNSTYRMNIEGVLGVSGTPTTSTRFFDSGNSFEVQVNDGRLTLTNGTGAVNNKVCFIEIVQVPVASN